jgi:hypothetical protein
LRETARRCTEIVRGRLASVVVSGGLVALVSCTSFEPATLGIADAGADSSGLVDAARDSGAEDAAKVLPQGLFGPIPYTSLSDSPFNGVDFPAYFYLEDWEDGLVNTLGVTPSSQTNSSAVNAGAVDSIDGDDGSIDGRCKKDGGPCNSGFADGTIDFTFGMAALGALPTHVGIAWTDGATNCDVSFEAYDATDTLIGRKNVTAVGDDSTLGTIPEDRFFSVVHTAGVKKIVVTSSGGGIEVDHLQYGR